MGQKIKYSVCIHFSPYLIISFVKSATHLILSPATHLSSSFEMNLFVNGADYKRMPDGKIEKITGFVDSFSRIL